MQAAVEKVAQAGDTVFFLLVLQFLGLCEDEAANTTGDVKIFFLIPKI